MSVTLQVDNQESLDKINDVIKRTNKENPKPEDLQTLKEVFDEFPELALRTGNLRNHIFNSILDTAVGKSALTREASERYIKNMKTELGYFSPTVTFVEKMLIDEITMRWLRLQVMEQSHYNSTTGQHSMKEGIYCEKRLHLTQKRYLQAIETLAKVRKMIAITQAKGAEIFKNLVEAKDKQDDTKL